MARSPRKPGTEPDLDALRRFSKLPDREATPYFGGRADEIDLVECALDRIRERVREGHWNPSGGETILFQGAPGAGKSALLHHLVRGWRSGGPEAPVVVGTSASHYASEGTLAGRVAKAVDPALAAQFRRSVTTHSSTAGSLGGGLPGVATVGAATETLRQEAVAPAEPTLDDVMEAVSKSRRTIVLVLDEVQVLESFDANATRSVITGLHTGSHGGPILPVFAGLAHSHSVLQDRGISRFSIDHDRTLEALSFDEAAETVHMMLAGCRVQGDRETKRQWAHALASESSGWPQHLHVAMRALAAQLLAASTPGQLEAVDSGFGIAVLQASARAREKYYGRRIDAPLSVARHLLAEIFRRMGDEATPDALLSHIREAAHSGAGSRSLPMDYNAERFLDHMIRRGVLQHTSGHTLACPIPSLRDYIERIAQPAAPVT